MMTNYILDFFITSDVVLLLFSILGTLFGLLIAAFLFRHSTLQRLSGLISAYTTDPLIEDGGRLTLAGVGSATRSLVRFVSAQSEARFVLLLLPDVASNSFTVAAGDGESKALEAMSLPLSHPLLRQLTTASEPIEMTDVAEYIPFPRFTLLFPIHSRVSLVGVLAVGPRSPHLPVRKRAQSAITLAASQAATTLENAQLYSSLRRALSDLENTQRELLALQRVSLAAQSTLRLDEVLAQIALGIVECLAFDVATVYLVDTETMILSTPVARGPGVIWQPSAESIPLDDRNETSRFLLANEVFTTHAIQDTLLPRLVEAGALRIPDLPRELTIVNVPLAAKERVIGGMTLATHERQVSDQQIQSLRSFAAQAAAAIENARLYGQIEHAYSDLRTAQEQLIFAERLRTLGQVAGGVVHDFNNILSAILARAQLARQQTRSVPLLESLAVIEQAAMDGANIVRRIQSLARPSGKRAPEAVDLNNMMQQALELTQPVWLNAACLRNVTITVETSFDASVPAEGQASEMREVITNLILNATEAMPAGGTLRLRTYERDGFVWCAVEDTGVGMTEEAKRRIFDPFFTTKGASGSGLGMNIVAAILEQHGGKAEIDTELGFGTTVRVGLPPATTRIAPKQQQHRRGRVSLRILIVEQDERTREALALMLTRYGHRVVTASNAERAVRYVVEQEFDVVITTPSLGDHTGWEVAEATKTIQPSSAVVLATAWAGQWTPQEIQARGVDAVLAKPFTIDEVLSSLEEALVGKKPAPVNATSH